MTADNDQPGQALAVLEYELTDELAVQAALALFEVQARDVKQKMVLLGAPHPALPLVIAWAMLVIAMAAALWMASDSLIALTLMAVGVLVQFLLLFKLALYFWPAFADSYIRRMALRMTRRLRQRTIRLSFFDDRLQTQSAFSERRLAWTDLAKVEVIRELWILTWKAGPPLAIAAAVLPEQQRSLILRNVKGA